MLKELSAELPSHLVAISLNSVEYGVWGRDRMFAFYFTQLYNLL